MKADWLSDARKIPDEVMTYIVSWRPGGGRKALQSGIDRGYSRNESE